MRSVVWKLRLRIAPAGAEFFAVPVEPGDRIRVRARSPALLEVRVLTWHQYNAGRLLDRPAYKGREIGKDQVIDCTNWPGHLVIVGLFQPTGRAIRVTVKVRAEPTQLG